MQRTQLAPACLIPVFSLLLVSANLAWGQGQDGVSEQKAGEQKIAEQKKSPAKTSAAKTSAAAHSAARG